MPSVVTKIFADRLQDLIASSGLSIKELSSNTRISTGALSKYQNDVSEAGIDALAKIAEYFGCSTDYLLGLSKHKNVEEKEHADAFYESLTDLISVGFDEHDQRRIKRALNEIVSGFAASCCDYATYTDYETAILSTSLAMSTIVGCVSYAYGLDLSADASDQGDHFIKIDEILSDATNSALRAVSVMSGGCRKRILDEFPNLIDARSDSRSYACKLAKLKEGAINGQR